MNNNNISSTRLSRSYLFSKYKSSYYESGKDLSIHTFILTGLFYLCHFFNGYVIKTMFAVLISLMLNRTFIVFHDCVHNSYTPSILLNYIISHITGIIVVTSPNWYLDHNTHHKTNGNIENLENYFFNETVTLTKKQYLQLTTKYQQLHYFYRHPIVFFTLIPQLYFVIFQRFIYAYKKIKRPYKYNKSLYNVLLDHIINNVGIFYLWYFLYKIDLLNEYLISLYINGSISFMIFHNQHSYNPAFIENNKEWTQYNSGIKGSAFTLIPRYLKYFYMGIEYHHIHHMNAKIPGYNLQNFHEEVVEKSGEFNNINKISIRDFISNLNLTLYDEDNNKYITFEELNKEKSN
jgi:omega-6 fatty acid desaturase (delta-12 desaturase)